jgi:hexosaminidase
VIHVRTFILFCLFAFVSIPAAAQKAQWQTMPYPAQVDVHDGQFIVDRDFSVALTGFTEPRLDRAVTRFLANLARETAIPLAQKSATKDASAKLLIHTGHASEKVQQLGEDESYTLEITPTQIKLDAATPLGVLRGLETILQAVQPGKNEFEIPAASIHDQPRFPWRGLLIDASRHWMPMDVVKRTLDGMSAVKMNVLHWHLSENQGFRVESKKLPKLQEMGSDGNYYTQADVKEILEYARDRGIRVVPEFDMPGHATAWFVGYPELASGPGPYSIEREWGIFDPAMDPTKESTYKFLDTFIGEMAELFPDQFFHIGGDEVNGKEWAANPKIQQFMKDHNLKDDHDLQGYFNQHVLKIVQKHKKTMMGWDEILHPDLPKDAVIHSWRGQDSLAAAARDGYRGLLSFGYYLDLAQPTAFHYSIDPMDKGAATLNEEEKKRILGGEACMWSEYVSTETVDSRIWPRTAAIAERLWSPQSVKDVDSMYARMQRASAQLSFLGLKHETEQKPMLERIADGGDTDALRLVADYVEPVKEYRRGQFHKYTQQTPLNRLIDAVSPESVPARDLYLIADRVANGQAQPEDVHNLRELFTAWRDLRFAPGNNALLAEAAAAGRKLATLGQIGLDVLDRMKSHQALTDDQRKQQLQAVQAASESDDLLIMGAPAVQRLLTATH